jgi:hypothetical protein
MAELTGITTNLGNATGAVTSESGWSAISYRGEENFYGNIWKWVDGINIYNYGEGSVYIADNDFTDNKNDGAYKDAGITISGTNGYISAFAYDEEYDWLFIASEVLGNASVPVGDYFYQNRAAEYYTVALLGGAWAAGSSAGGFVWALNSSAAARDRALGGRSLYVPKVA